MAKISKIINLSNEIYENLPGYPGLPAVEFNRLFEAAKDGFTLTEIKLHTHAGTHMDAPLHFEPGGETLEFYSMEDLWGEAAIVDLSGKLTDKEEITVEMLETYGKHIKEGDFVVINTGWFNKRGPTETWQNNFPALNKESADWLVNKKIRGLGLDTVAADMFGSPDFAVHHTLFGNNIFIVEELTNLDKIPTERFYVAINPLNIPGMDGCPARILALEFD